MPKKTPSVETATLKGLIRERAQVGYGTFLDLDTITTLPMFAMPWVMMAVAVFLSVVGLGQLSNSATLVLSILYLSLFGVSITTMVFADWHKRGVGKGKQIAKAQLLFMEPNSTTVRGGYEHTIVHTRTDPISAESPVKVLTDRVFTQLPDIKGKAAKEIMDRIEQHLPRLPNGKRYKLVRWLFPDTPFPDLVLEKGRWVRGGKGTPLNPSLLLLAHEDYTEPNEAFDYFEDKVTTFYGNYESQESARAGSIALWEFYHATQAPGTAGEWVATVGLAPEYRRTMQQVRPDEKVRTYENLVELMRTIPSLQGSETEKTMTKESLTQLVRSGQVFQAQETGVKGLTGNYEKDSIRAWITKNSWVILVIVLLLMVVIVFR